MVSASQPIRDADIWWHRWIGQEILSTRSVAGLGAEWAPFGDLTWRTTQWFPEVLYAWLGDLAGWSAITGLRVLAAVAISLVVAWSILPGRPALVAVPIYCLTLLGLIPFAVQDRPQTLALVLAGLLSVQTSRWLLEDRIPRVWVVLLLSAVWANLHGSWVLVPLTLGLLAVGKAFSASPGRTAILRYCAIVLAGIAGGFATPAGLSSVTAVARFSERTNLLTEWQPTALTALYALPLGLSLAVLLWAWARGPVVPADELVFAAGLTIFALLANRNVSYSLLLLAPVVAARLAVVYPHRSLVGRREANLLAVATALVLLVGLALAWWQHATTDPLALAAPRRIAALLGDAPEPVGVLNSYGASGVLLEFSGGNVQLAIDGRADRYPSDYSSSYLDAVRSLQDWQALVEQVVPDVAVLKRDEALADHLQDQGWTVTLRDGEYLLLEPPVDR